MSSILVYCKSRQESGSLELFSGGGGSFLRVYALVMIHLFQA
jgi:hypothetical protein